MTPDRGSAQPCDTCRIPHANQHSIRESAKCDGIKAGYLHQDGSPTGKVKGQSTDDATTS